ncbi:MAG TPA: hypothetical protein VJS67_04720 [Pseudonocardiaceae bacterium]|nr:hypothetical protein [Pseudonocardiaceae bacterium]
MSTDTVIAEPTVTVAALAVLVTEPPGPVVAFEAMFSVEAWSSLGTFMLASVVVPPGGAVMVGNGPEVMAPSNVVTLTCSPNALPLAVSKSA